MARDDNSSDSNLKFVESKISQRPLVIFSKTKCPYSAEARKLFEELNVKKSAILVVEVDQLDNKEREQSIEQFLDEYTGTSGLPSVFLGGSHIGGCDELHELDESGTLKLMLKKAGAL